jgi:NADH:ubiquinone oxidoreductase subunit 6 (subunit J)
MDAEMLGAIVAAVAVGATVVYFALGAVGTKSRREIRQELYRSHTDGKPIRR